MRHGHRGVRGLSQTWVLPSSRQVFEGSPQHQQDMPWEGAEARLAEAALWVVVLGTANTQVHLEFLILCDHHVVFHYLEA
mmetsp:Transcript_32281/g.70663  ORF Transcript_32281/g.70663 Transcript_32281/m.70663 type:complete len:80 (+) Transcript_32281:1945-2184(+)